ncbi:MAG TPA: hypothetical protein VEF33_07260 [Syntrophales bacterium]|nr:hypothetical protein [Syntrophales bacterium]
MPQGTDLLRDLAERISGNSVNNWIRFSFFTSVLIWAVCSWYWSRVMLFLCFPGVPGNDYKLLKFRKWVPRCIGFAAALSIAAALVKASFGYDSRNDYASILLLEYAGETLVSALIFLYVVSNRRDWMISAYKSLQSVRILQRPIVSPFVSFLNVQPAEKLEYGIKDVGELPTSVKVVTCATFFGAVFLFLLFLFTLQQTAPLMGTAAIFLFALAGWIAVGSLLDFFGMQLRFPVVTSLLVLATIFSICNDNHTVRTIPTKPVPMENRMDIRHALKTWYQYQLRRASPTGNYPLFIVAAEGGGIRAAYWTANVLSKITDSNPSFPDQLFALSSVSGGSLGSAVFIAQLADAPVTADGFHCDKDGRHLPGARDFQPVTKLILGEDFLSPAVGAMLYPDLVQRFLPFPIDRFDRARALEGAWERAWSKHTGNKRFSEQFDNLWPVGGKTWTPALFLNSTWVETGKRLIVSNLRLTAEEFNDAEDLNSFYTEQSLPLSTAVHLSARFTYISPAGTLKKDGKIYGRAVDGGYFENSGETTVFEILKTIDTLAKKDIRWKKIQPIVIHISNEPVDPKFTNISLGTDKKCKDKASRPRHYLNEALSPPITLLHTRNARGVYARETVKSYDVAYKFFQFGLCRDRMEVPLGWVLSDVIQGQMDKQLVENSCTVFHNSDNLEKINVLLKMRYKQNNVSGQISETPS